MASREEELLAAILGENWTECEPHSRIEKIWQYALQVSGVEPEPAHSRIEALAIQVAELVRNGGGGGGDHTAEDGLVDRTLGGSYSNNRVDTIGQHAMRGFTTLKNVKFAEATTVSQNAFYGNAIIETVKLPKVKTIGREAFLRCYGLTAINLPALESIGVNGFQDCSALALMNLYSPDRTAIPTLSGTGALSGTAIASGNGYIVINDDLVDTLKAASNWSTYASQIVSYSYAVEHDLIDDSDDDDEPEVRTLNITENGTYNVASYARADVAVDIYEIANSMIDGSISGAFSSSATSIRSQGLNGCSLITSVDFPDATRIGQYSFSNCSSLETVNFPNVSTISQYAFTNCVGLTRVDLPSISSIGQFVFRDCSNLEVLNLYSPERTSVPTLVNSNTFNGTKIADGTGYIVINDDLVDTLKAASNWSTFASQIVSHTYAVEHDII